MAGGLHLRVGTGTTTAVAAESWGPPDPPDNTGKQWRESAGCLQVRADGVGLAVHPGRLCYGWSELWL